MSTQGQVWQKDAADQNFDYMFKLLIIGNSSVGKTSFLARRSGSNEKEEEEAKTLEGPLW